MRPLRHRHKEREEDQFGEECHLCVLWGMTISLFTLLEAWNFVRYLYRIDLLLFLCRPMF